MMKKENFGFVLLAVLALILLAGCGVDSAPQMESAAAAATLPPALTATPEPSATVTPQPLATRPTIRPQWVTPTGPTRTSMPTTPRPTSTPTATSTLPPNTPTVIPSRTPVLTPGEDMDLLFLSEGTFFVYNLKTWSAKVWFEIHENGFDLNTISDDMRWLVYTTDQGTWLRQVSKNGKAVPIPVIEKYENARQRMKFNFSPDGQYLAFADDEGFKLLEKPFNGEPTLIQLFDFDLTKSDQSIYFFSLDHSVLFASDSKSLFYQYDNIMYQYLIEQKSLVQMGKGYISGFSPDRKWLLYTLDWMYYFSYEFLHLPSSEITSVDTCRWFGEWAPDSSALPSHSYYSERDGCRAADGVSLLVPEGNTLVEKVIYQDLETPDDGTLDFLGMEWDEAGKKLFFVKNIGRIINRNDPDMTFVHTAHHYIMVYDRESNQTREVAQYFNFGFVYSFIKVGNTILYVNRNDSERQLMRLDMDTEKISLVCKVWDDLHLSDSISGTDWVIANHDDQDGYPVLINYRTGKMVSTYFGNITPSGGNFLGLLPKN